MTEGEGGSVSGSGRRGGEEEVWAGRTAAGSRSKQPPKCPSPTTCCLCPGATLRCVIRVSFLGWGGSMDERERRGGLDSEGDRERGRRSSPYRRPETRRAGCFEKLPECWRPHRGFETRRREARWTKCAFIRRSHCRPKGNVKDGHVCILLP